MAIIIQNQEKTYRSVSSRRITTGRNMRQQKELQKQHAVKSIMMTRKLIRDKDRTF
jgi:hypothetical protein